MSTRSPGTYFIWDAALLYAGPGGRSAVHAHHLLQVGVSTGPDIKVRAGPDAPYERCRGFIIGADVPHQVVCAARKPVYFLWIDPESRAARRMQAVNPRWGESVTVLESGTDDFRLPSDVPSTCTEAADVRRGILSTLGARDDEPDDVDERVRAAAAIVRERRRDDIPPIDELAEAVHLSASRLMHLFSEQIGIPIRRYALWQRLMLAIRLVVDGANLTEAALESGFADAAHMSRTFRDMFGTSPSSLFKNSRFVQAIGCSAG